MQTNAPAWLTDRPIAHRGLHDAARGAIENTLAAAEAAINTGFAIECDVQMSADGEIFVFHDETLERLTEVSGRLIDKAAAEIRKARITSPRPQRPLPEWGKGVSIPTFSEFLVLVAGRTPIICELKSRFDGDFRLGDRITPLAAAYEGPLALKSFDPDLVAYLRLRWPVSGPRNCPCPVGIVAEASYDDPYWDWLASEQRRRFTDWEELMRSRPDFVSFNVDDLPHKTPFLMKELHHLPVMAWTVRNAAQREAAGKWADQTVFEGEGRPL